METLHSTLLGRHDGLLHAFTTRRGGISAAPYASANIAFHVGDDELSVRANQKRLADTLGYGLETLVHMRQVHSDIVHTLERSPGFEHPLEGDALVTDRPGIPLMVMTADCIPVLLFDPRRRVIAAVHAGRAGALKAIVPATLKAMRHAYGCDTGDIIAVLGPAIHGCCYEVGETIAKEARDAGYGYAVQLRQGRHHLDVNAIVLRQLADAGVSTEHTEVMPFCCACENGRFFSYRADAQRTGRMAGVIMLR